MWRIAAGRGLEDVTLRQVAADAGVSMRLVQYYFGTREELLTGALAILNAASERQARERVTTATTPRGVLRATLLELLPLDEQRRTRALVHIAYFVRSLHDGPLAATFRDAPPAREDLVTQLLTWGESAGETTPGIDAALEAELLVNSVVGLESSVILGRRTGEQAVALIDRQLDRLIDPARRPPLCAAPDTQQGDTAPVQSQQCHLAATPTVHR